MTKAPNLAQTFKKAVLSSFVILSFVVYTLHEHLNGSAEVPFVAPQPTVVAVAPPPARPTPSALSGPARSNSSPASPLKPSPTPVPTALPAPAGAVPGSQFKDGEFTGNAVNAYWGNVQVKAVIRSGRVSDVQFVDYPHDRRTSQRINDYALSVLKTEAIQKQNANVNIISGATLTSEAFVRSLQSALSKAGA